MDMLHAHIGPLFTGLVESEIHAALSLAPRMYCRYPERSMSKS